MLHVVLESESGYIGVRNALYNLSSKTLRLNLSGLKLQDWKCYEKFK